MQYIWGNVLFNLGLNFMLYFNAVARKIFKFFPITFESTIFVDTWSMNLMVVRVIQKFSALLWINQFVTVFTRSQHRFICSLRRVPLHKITSHLFQIHFYVILPIGYQNLTFILSFQRSSLIPLHGHEG